MSNSGLRRLSLAVHTQAVLNRQESISQTRHLCSPACCLICEHASVFPSNTAVSHRYASQCDEQPVVRTQPARGALSHISFGMAQIVWYPQSLEPQVKLKSESAEIDTVSLNNAYEHVEQPLSKEKQQQEKPNKINL